MVALGYGFIHFQWDRIFRGRNDQERFYGHTKLFLPNPVLRPHLRFATTSRNTFHVGTKQPVLAAPDTGREVPRASSSSSNTVLAAAGRFLPTQGQIVRDGGGDLIRYEEDGRGQIC